MNLQQWKKKPWTPVFIIYQLCTNNNETIPYFKLNQPYFLFVIYINKIAISDLSNLFYTLFLSNIRSIFCGPQNEYGYTFMNLLPKIWLLSLKSYINSISTYNSRNMKKQTDKLIQKCRWKYVNNDYHLHISYILFTQL